jgi:hypothetical protein
MADDNLLKKFKSRLHIFHDSEDENLKSILEESKSEIKRMTGSDDLTNEGVQSLIIERSRYVYNDSVEFFEGNFQSQILGVSANLTIGTGDDNDESIPETKNN